MKIVESPLDVSKIENGSYIAIGKWDGVHLGHQQLIRYIVKCAKRDNCKAIVISFDRHPLSVLKPGSEPVQIQSVSERSDFLAKLGVDIHLVLPFTKEFASFSPENFVKTILAILNPIEVVVGYNFRFGKDRIGTPELLQNLCKRYGIKVKVASPVYLKNEIISSTLIRSYMQNGEEDKVTKLLGRPASKFQEKVSLIN